MDLKCPICNCKTLINPTNIEVVSLFFVPKGEQDINITQSLSTTPRLCKDCGYVMLFKK